MVLGRGGVLGKRCGERGAGGVVAAVAFGEAQRMTMPSRVRSLRAVSGLSCQTGRNTRARSLVVI